MKPAGRMRQIALVAPVIAGAAVFVLPLPLEPAGRRALAIAVWMIGSWILEPIHPAVVGFAGCFFFVAAGCAEFDTAFGGFGEEAPWALYGALMLTVAAQSSGAIRRLERAVPDAAAAAIVVALALAGGAAIEAPAARAVIAVVAALALSARLDQRTRVSSRLPLVAVASYAAAVLGPDGSGGAPSLLARVAGVAVCVAIASLFVRPVRRDEPAASVPAEQPSAGRVLALLALAIAAWVTAPLHHVSTGLIALGFGIAAAFPGLRPGARGPVADPIALMLAGAALSVPLVLEETHAASAVTSALAPLGEYWRNVAAGLIDPQAHPPAGAPAVKFAVYQSPALIFGAAIAGLTTRDVLKYGVALALAGAVVSLLA
jgi:hypothetical protein